MVLPRNPVPEVALAPETPWMPELNEPCAKPALTPNPGILIAPPATLPVPVAQPFVAALPAAFDPPKPVVVEPA